MKLTIRRVEWMGDWYVIERAPAGRFSDADVEGTFDEMQAIADAIEQRSTIAFRRCAVSALKEPVSFCSPRNSRRDGECSYEEAADLAEQIRALPGKFDSFEPADVGKPCAYCGKPCEGHFSIHRDGFGIGPEVPLCDAHGGGELPSCEQIWAKIAKVKDG